MHSINDQPAISVQFRDTQVISDYETHFHGAHEIIFTLEGTAEFIIENKKYVLPENSLLVVSNFERHYRLSASYPYRRYVLLFNDCNISVPDSNLLSIFLQRNKQFRHVVTFSKEYAEKIKHIFSEFVNECIQNDRFTSLLLNAKLSELLICIYRACPENFSDVSENNYRKIIYDAQQYVHNNFRKPITLESVAEHFFANIYYFSSKFKEYTGVSFKKYLINLRLVDAKQQLLATDKPIHQIAKDCGFNDVSNFIRTFQAKENSSPLQFRKQHETDS